MGKCVVQPLQDRMEKEFRHMKMPRIVVASLAGVSLLGLSACVTDPNTGERKVSRTAIGAGGGALAGYLLGGLIGGDDE